MWHTFGYRDSTIFIASKVWGDFAANLPLIRSFSLGSNFPPEYPLFPGEPIKYHFLFYMVVGLLEKAGLRLDWALNLASSLSFFFLTVMIYKLARLLFKNRTVSFLSVIFFLFNGTFSFLEFLKTRPLLTSIFRLTEYPSFMPYGPGEVTAFWSLNTFINQRHLALGFSVLLFIIYKIITGPASSKIIFLGFLFGLFPSLHKAVFVMAGLIFFCLFLFFKKLRLQICLICLIGLICALPQLYFTNQLGIQTESAISFYPGYLVYGQGLLAFLRHWLMNLGLNIFLIPLGFVLAPKQAKKVFLAFFSLFIIGNLFKFSPEISANHKFFNLFIIVGNMFSAYALYRIWTMDNRKWKIGVDDRKSKIDNLSSNVNLLSLSSMVYHLLSKIIVIVLIFFLTFSGLIDLIVIKNDFQYQIIDAPKNPDILWIKNNTSPKSIFLNTSYFYHPASLAGRKIFYGWPYYAWSAGYNSDVRKEIIKQIFSAQTTKDLCRMLKTNKIDYVALEKEISIEEISEAFLRIKNLNQDFWKKNFVAAYTNKVSGFKIYQTEAICLKIFSP